MRHAAAEARDEVLIRCLIEARADVTLEGKHGRSLLHLAVGETDGDGGSAGSVPLDGVRGSELIRFYL